eukprot:TRINITY_DN3520_c0_g2_i7.p1 TRINITY_DN3520_c0_g2~~TRINITY_DN3520_c0_g2_i7.p1  ORF type:complete len:159 (+),score=28.32 TRINITY_DN3520_c0_g2_i7:469-945(+)
MKVMKLASPFERHTIQQFPRPSPIRVDPYTGTMTGSGKRKTAHANVAIFLNGTGQITINGKHWIDYFPSIFVRSVMMEPIIATELINEVDIKVETWGGGFMGQAEAIRNAIAVAMVRADPEYKFIMSQMGMLKVDHRKKERKHTGFRKARKKQQWVKR